MRLTVGMALVCLSLVGITFANDAKATSQQSTSIDAQQLAPALNMLARDRHVQLVYRSDLVQHQRTGGAVGDLTFEEALVQLLAGTGLTYRYLENNAVTIVSIAASPSRRAGAEGSGAAGSIAPLPAFEVVQPRVRLAQVPATPASPAADSDSDKKATSVALQEVVVSAERRETDLQKTPISIVAFDAESLESRNIRTIMDLSSFTPGLSIGGEVEAGGTKPVFMIRGIGQPGGREAQERGVGLYVDDVYIPRTTGSLLQLLDVERVEVLRGPQGTLFGRNTPGGAIRYLTRKPDNQFAGEFTAAVGSFERRDVTGLVNVPLGDSLSARFQFGSFQRDGHVDVIALGQTLGSMDDTVVRGALRFTPGENLTVDASIVNSISRYLGPAGVVTELVPGTFQYLGLNARLVKLGQAPLVANDPRFVLADKYAVNGTCYLGVNSHGLANANGTTIFNDQTNYCDYGEKQRNTISSVDVNWRVNDEWSLRSLSAYVDGRSDSINSWGRMYVDHTKDIDIYHSFSQEFQLKFSRSGLNVVGGLYYFEEQPTAFNYNRYVAYAGPAPFSGDCCTGWNRTRNMHTDSYGVFTQLSWDITDRLQTTLGGRYSYDKKSIAASRSDSPAIAPGRLLTGSKHWSDTDYRVTVQYGFTPSLMAYATHATGYKSGGWNDAPAMSAGLNSGITPYDAEHVKSYEAGVKSQWLDDSLRFNLTGFFMDYRDLQIGTPLIDTSTLPPAVVSTVQNAGRVDLSGIEAELLYRPVRQLTLNASVSTLHQHYKFLADGNALLRDCANPAAPTFSTCGTQDLGRAPRLQYTAGVQYQVNLAADAMLDLAANYAFVDEQQSSSSTTNSVLLPSYGLLNLRAQFTPASTRWSLALVATNVTDKYYYTSGGNLSGFFGTKWAAPGRPREVGVELKAKF